MSTKDTNPKDAVGSNKPPLTTIPFTVLFEVGTAMLEGACKYRRHNYRVAGVRASIYIDAAMRHLGRWWEGESIDPDSGVSHLVKAIAGLIVLRDAQMQGLLNDDRPPASDPNWFKQVEEQVKAVLHRYPSPLPPFTQEEVENLSKDQQ